ncbi:MAG: hypothetical protein KF775_14810 [Cyclobacteriaceae bacterium]|nr:hypothetical protein [Cyclobacteriaceae bacterium]
MKTYLLNLNEVQEEAVLALIKQLKIEVEIYSETDEDKALTIAMEDGKKYGRLTEKQSSSFLENLGK